jgi:hypothetical protein
MARQSIEIPQVIKDLAELEERSVNWICQQAFNDYVRRHPIPMRVPVTKERKQNASSKRQRRR